MRSDYRVTLSYACFMISVENNKIVDTAHIGNWMFGKSFEYVAKWIKNKKGTLELLTDKMICDHAKICGCDKKECYVSNKHKRNSSCEGISYCTKIKKHCKCIPYIKEIKSGKDSRKN